MLPLSPFDLHKQPLFDILQSVKYGKIQLADFQRDWCWEDQRIRSLLCEVSLGFPVGTLMLLEQNQTNAAWHLKPRLVEGVELEDPPRPDFLVLDGQQRLTSLFMALLSEKPVRINRGKRYRPDQRWYYFDILKSLELPETRRDEAIIGLNANKKFRNSQQGLSLDCSNPEDEYKADLFPVSELFHFSRWRSHYCQYWHYQPDKLGLIDRFEAMVVKKFEHYQLGLHVLCAQLPRAAICHIFVRHNELPCELTHFDLLTSEYAWQDLDLRADWATREKTFLKYKVLRLLKPTEFLQSISLISTYHSRLEAEVNPLKISNRVTFDRQNILSLGVEEYQRWAGVLTKGFESAAQFLHTQGIYDADDLPYSLQLVVMSPLMAILREDSKLDGGRRKLEQWFYCGAASGIYSRSRESVAAKDLLEIPLWVLKGCEMPTSVIESHITEKRLQNLVNSQGAAYRAISALLRRDGALDFLTGEEITDIKYFEEKIENHHIFPRDWCKKMGIGRGRYNSIVNKTPLRAKTNRFLGGQSPKDYLERLEGRGMSQERLDVILRSHLIEPELLRANDFEGFFQNRTEQILQCLQTAMGKG